MKTLNLGRIILREREAALGASEANRSERQRIIVAEVEELNAWCLERRRIEAAEDKESEAKYLEQKQAMAAAAKEAEARSLEQQRLDAAKDAKARGKLIARFCWAKFDYGSPYNAKSVFVLLEGLNGCNLTPWNARPWSQDSLAIELPDDFASLRPAARKNTLARILKKHSSKFDPTLFDEVGGWNIGTLAASQIYVGAADFRIQVKYAYDVRRIGDLFSSSLPRGFSGDRHDFERLLVERVGCAPDTKFNLDRDTICLRWLFGEKKKEAESAVERLSNAGVEVAMKIRSNFVGLRLEP